MVENTAVLHPEHNRSVLPIESPGLAWRGGEGRLMPGDPDLAIVADSAACLAFAESRVRNLALGSGYATARRPMPRNAVARGGSISRAHIISAGPRKIRVTCDTLVTLATNGGGYIENEPGSS